ncbi:hypothetical protein GCM10010411_58370 [Actinomadura fulvescens]|uniref:PASTA domain-containing protein n=2 Tax=Actinomadura fulvescens TaxID=46160 RepID=A0ABP6CKR0_9ACTN
MPAAVLALALSVSACGSDDKDPKSAASGSPSSGAGSTAPSAPAVITPSNNPAPGSGAGAGNGSGGGTGNLSPAQKKSHAKLVKVAACMRAKGYTVDDPKPGDFGVTPKNVTDADKANKDSADCVKQANAGG